MPDLNSPTARYFSPFHLLLNFTIMVSFLKSFHKRIKKENAEYNQFLEALSANQVTHNPLYIEPLSFLLQFLELKNNHPDLKILSNKDAPIRLEKGCPHCGASITYKATSFLKIGVEKIPKPYTKYLYLFEANRLDTGVCANMPPQTSPEFSAWEATHPALSVAHQMRLEDDALNKIRQEYVFLLTEDPTANCS